MALNGPFHDSPSVSRTLRKLNPYDKKNRQEKSLLRAVTPRRNDLSHPLWPTKSKLKWQPRSLNPKPQKIEGQSSTWLKNILAFASGLRKCHEFRGKQQLRDIYRGAGCPSSAGYAVSRINSTIQHVFLRTLLQHKAGPKLPRFNTKAALKDQGRDLKNLKLLNPKP